MEKKAAFRRVIRSDVVVVIGSVLAISLLLSQTSTGFTSAYNLSSLARTIAVTALVGFSQLFALSIGHFNLALGAIGAIGAVLAAALMMVYNLPIWIAIVAGLLAGALAGAIQGWLIMKTGINPFVITLSLASIYLGGLTALTKAKFFDALPEAFNRIGNTNFLGLPVMLLTTLIIAVALWTLVARTPLGRQLLAVGANPAAATFAGIPTGAIIVYAHTVSGFLAAAAGILLAARLNVAQISIGTDWLLISFAAPVLGGTILSGGKVSVVGTICGAALMALITNMLVVLGVNFFWFQTFLGFILLGAYALDRARLSYLSQTKA